MERIQSLGRGQRILLFIAIFGGGLLLIIAITLFLILQAINASPRDESRAIRNDAIILSINGTSQSVVVDVREFALLPGDNAHPGSVAVGADGTVYTGSYDTGAIWSIPPTGNVNREGSTIEGALLELTDTRELIGSVTSLEVAPDGSLYVLDRIDSNPRSAGGTVWKIDPNGEIMDLGEIASAEGFVSPGHITVDSSGNLYVTDRGRRDVWRYTPDGDSALFWSVPSGVDAIEAIIPTGIAYDASTDTLIIGDSEVNVVFRVSMDGETTEELYRFDRMGEAPSFDGVAVAEDGTIYLAALNVRRVAALIDGELYYLAENFRQVSDVAVLGNRIYATNLDGRSLVLPGVEPQLPFSIDVIELIPAETGE